ncbi:MAG: DUF3006 domain-containing protein [Clostridiales bacterium]|jgi:hypothetical protein|nr:DUF3006 domain-containing protein [Clostridiales bacterium]
MFITVDRVCGGYLAAELPDRTMVDLPMKIAPGAREGDVLEININKEETLRRKAEAERAAEGLWL